MPSVRFEYILLSNLAYHITNTYFELIYYYLKKCRNRNLNIIKRKKVTLCNKNLTHCKLLSEISNDRTKCPHTLMELSSVQFTRIKHNAICVSGLYETEKTLDVKSCIKYKQVTYGDALKVKKNMKSRVCSSNGKTLRWNSPMLHNIKGGFLCILADKSEIIHHDSSVIILDGSNQQDESTCNGYVPSGKLLLFWAE